MLWGELPKEISHGVNTPYAERETGFRLKVVANENPRFDTNKSRA